LAEDPPDAEVKYFGLIPTAQGRGLGPFLLDASLRSYWQTEQPRRLWLHTDTWDHPKAMGLYARMGFQRFAVHDLPASATHQDYRTAIGLTPRDPQVV
jgi:GNAT superfamily N-acetyltransferase